MSVKIIQGDCRDVLKTLADKSVHCCVTSPPYFGLRDYGTASWSGGDSECDHRHGRPGSDRADGIVGMVAHRNRDGVGSFGGDCKHCGAVRTDSQIGLEATPDAFVAELVAVFREVRRVLRDDGTLWLNLGDSYAASGRGGNPDDSPHQKQASNRGSRQFFQGHAVEAGAIGRRWVKPPAGYKQKDLIGIPWLVAFALRADGWYLRQDIIWSKPNPMPESVTDRCTKAHEYIFMMSKSARYHYDAAAIAEDAIYAGLTGQDESGFKNAANFSGKNSGGNPVRGEKPDKQRGHGRRHDGFNDRWDKMEKAEQCSGKRNKRSVWSVATAPYAEAHFATFPPALIEPCILAGCPKGGMVLDPFGGAGTTGLVADRLQRSAILVELNPAYAEMSRNRITDDAPLFTAAE